MHPEAERVYARIIGGLARHESLLRKNIPDTEDNQHLHTHIDGVETARLLIEKWHEVEQDMST